MTGSLGAPSHGETARRTHQEEEQLPGVFVLPPDGCPLFSWLQNTSWPGSTTALLLCHPPPPEDTGVWLALIVTHARLDTVP